MTFRVAGFLWWLFILLVTLTPIPSDAAHSAATPWNCLICGELGGIDVLYNTLIFVPLGAMVRLGGWSAGRTLVLVAVTTLAVEAAQAFWIAGRDSSLSDLLTNSAGGALGTALATSAPALILPTGRLLRWLVVGAALIPLAVLSATAWLLRPAPSESLWFGQWAPDLGQYDRFDGTVVTATIQGQFMPADALKDVATRGISWERTPLRMTARFTPGSRTGRVAPIVSIFDKHQRKVALIGQEGDRLRFEARIRSEDWKLRPLAIALAGPVAARRNDTLETQADFDGRTMSLSLSGPRQTLRQQVALSPALGWALVAPIGGTLDQDTRLFSALWLALLWAPLGFYAVKLVVRRDSSRFVVMLILAAAASAASGLVTLAAALPAGHWSELAGAGLGAAAGAWLGGSPLPRRIATLARSGLKGVNAVGPPRR
jgi:hypothetical protein